METVLGIDLGTQSIKVLFYDFEARDVVTTGSAQLQLHQTENGVAEQRAEWWIDALHKALRTIDEKVRATVRAVSVSGQQHGFVPVAANGDVLAPVKLWCDTSTAAEADAIMQDFGGREACIQELGNPVAPGYTAPKIRWLRDAMPDAYARMRYIMLPHDYLNYYLTGNHCMEAGDASGTGLLDVRRRIWSEKMLRAVDPNRDLADCVPAVRHENCAVGELRQDRAAELGLPANVAVAIGGGDNMMGAIGTGNVRPGNVTMSLGTSGTVYACSDTPIVDPHGNIAAFCASTGGWLPLLCTMNCTISTELMRGLFGTDIEQFEAGIAAASSGAGGVITVPFFNGERTPDLPNARGCITGLTSSNATRENLLRSSVEGATYALKFGVDELVELGVDCREIVLTGGGAKSATWRQLVADICAAPVVVLQQDEGAAFGAALQALQVIRSDTSIEELVDEHLSKDEARSCDPRAPDVDRYSNFYGEYRRAVDTLGSMYR